MLGWVVLICYCSHLLHEGIEKKIVQVTSWSLPHVSGLWQLHKLQGRAWGGGTSTELG